jgi:hypothetical protein
MWYGSRYTMVTFMSRTRNESPKVNDQSMIHLIHSKSLIMGVGDFPRRLPLRLQTRFALALSLSAQGP